MSNVLGERFSSRDIKDSGWYWLERTGAPRGYVYVSSDPDSETLYLHAIQLKEPLVLKPGFYGVFYKVSDQPYNEMLDAEIDAQINKEIK